VLILGLWLGPNPGVWSRQPVDFDILGYTQGSISWCMYGDSKPFILTLVFFNAGTLLFTCTQAYILQMRYPSSSNELNETGIICASLYSVLQSILFSSPLLILGFNHPPLYFFLGTVTMFVMCISPLILVYGRIGLMVANDTSNQRPKLSNITRGVSHIFTSSGRLIGSFRNLTHSPKSLSRPRKGNPSRSSAVDWQELRRQARVNGNTTSMIRKPGENRITI
jgi:hypothetical protein